MTEATPAAVVNLAGASTRREYSVSVYAVTIALVAVAALVVGAHVLLNQGFTVSVLLALGVAAILAVLSWSVWEMKPWRYRLGYGVHIGGILFGIALLLSWLGHVVNLINADEAIIESGHALSVILREIPSLPIDTLQLADGLLLLLINGGLLAALRYFRQAEAERHVDQTYHSELDLLLERFLNNNSARIGGMIVLLLLVTTYIMPRLDPYHGLIVLRDGDLSHRLDPPDCIIGWLRLQQGVDVWEGEGPAPQSPFEFPCEHPFGFDKNGRDMARRVLHGIGVSLAVSLIAVSISLFIGATTGLVAGYLGGWVDSLLMRLMDIMLAFPSLLLAIAIVAMRGPGLENGMIAIGVVGIPVYARLARSMAISIREQEYVTAARSIGAGHWRILGSHVLPNSLAPLIVQSTLGLGTAVIETAALGFLGLGQQPPFPELGKMLAESREVMTSGKWWVMVFPGITVMMIVLGFNLLGDALRDTLDPQLRGK